MSPIAQLLLLAGSFASLSSSTPIGDAAAACVTGVHMLVARGSTESPGEGALSALSSQIKKQIAGSDSVGVPYPATLDNYPASEAQGVGNLTKLIKDYTATCPKSKIVLLGYSQGAQVSLDTLCGNTDSGFDTTAPIATQYTKNIIAVVAFGDPSHVAGKSYDLGTSKKDGIFPRQGTYCDNFGKIIHSYCDFNDTFCDSGSSIQVHQSYLGTYGYSAANWVVSKYQGK